LSPRSLAKDSFRAGCAANEEAFLIHIIGVRLVDIVFFHLRMEQIEVGFVLAAVVSFVPIAIDSSAPFGGEFVRMATQKPRNPALHATPDIGSVGARVQDETCPHRSEARG
jgi:hypothetical protein